jgi:hypothetical protein
MIHSKTSRDQKRFNIEFVFIHLLIPTPFSYLPLGRFTRGDGIERLRRAPKCPTTTHTQLQFLIPRSGFIKYKPAVDGDAFPES